MINLVRADLYKELKKKSFWLMLVLIIFVSILALVIINKNMDVKSEEIEVYSLMEESEYKNVNKYGSYEHYFSNYQKYYDRIQIENEILRKNKVSSARKLLSYSHGFIFMFGIFVIILAYNNLSYDYQNGTLKYIFMTKYKRYKVFLSKIISLMFITLSLLTLFLLLYLIVTFLLTGENIFAFKEFIYNKGNYIEVSGALMFFRNSFLYFIPFLFMIVFSMFLCIIFKGSSLGLVLGGIIYFVSLTFSQVMFSYGYMFIKYTFLPYIDFTYLSDVGLVQFNNLVYNINFSYTNSVLILLIYTVLFMLVSLNLFSRDV